MFLSVIGPACSVHTEHSHSCVCNASLRRTLKLAPQTDHAGPLMIPAGADKFKDVGRPRGVMDGNVQAGLQVGGFDTHTHTGHTHARTYTHTHTHVYVPEHARVVAGVVGSWEGER